jgi:hypothetical protein
MDTNYRQLLTKLTNHIRCDQLILRDAMCLVCQLVKVAQAVSDGK